MTEPTRTTQMTTNLLSSNHLQAMSDYTIVTKYARYNEKKQRRETWDEMVDRVRDMHLFRYGSRGINEDINWAFEQVRSKKVLPSMRSLQYGGDAIIANDARMYNCSFSLVDRPRFFSECLWLLLSGTGVGFSVQKQHVIKLPKLIEYHDATEKEVMIYTIGDTIEGWSDALQMLMDSYFAGTPLSNKEIFFDYTRIRRKGSKLRTSGGRAPGPKPLQRALKRIKRILIDAVHSGQEKLRPIQVYDVITMAADCVLAGGIRKSATIALFSPDDQEMMKAKTEFYQDVKILTDMRRDGSWLTDVGVAWDLDKSNPEPPTNGSKCNVGWFNLYPWRQLSNNSAALLRSECEFKDFDHIIDCAKSYGEPGFVFLDNLNYGYNPCFSADTKILTDCGYKTISELWEEGEYQQYNSSKSVDEYGYINIINSHGVVKATNVYKTSDSSPIYEVQLENGNNIKTTSNHSFFKLLNDGTKQKIQLKDLKIGDALPLINDNNGSYNSYPKYYSKIKSIEYIGDDATYCLTEPQNNEVCANGIIVSQCSEIGLNPIDPKTGETGFQTCNLTEINGGAIKSKEDFITAIKAATIIGTLQAGYTYFNYLSEASRNIIRREALLGVSVTGWMDNPKLLLDPNLQREMAKYAIEINKEYAEKIGINQAARVTCTKPAGTTSIVLGTGSGIHPHHARYYFRRVRMNKTEKPLEYFKIHNPKMVEPSVSNDYDEIITFCVQVPESAVLKKDLGAIDFLKMVKETHENWVIPGTAKPDSSPGLTHNVSNTVTIKADEWDDVAKFIYDNRQCFSGISMLADFGDKAYQQAPMERVESEEDIKRWNEMVKNYQSIDWALFHENDDYTEIKMTVACAGGACQLE